MTFKELFQKLDVDSNALGKGLPPEFNLAGDVSEDVLVKFIRFLLDTAMVLKTERKWHTGKPTEDGEYVVLCQYRKDDGKLRIHKTVFEFKNGEWTELPALEGILDEYELIAWYGQKIEPYKGN